MGPWCLRRGVGESLPLPDLSAEYRPRTIGPTCRNSAIATKATARQDEPLQRTHPGADGPVGLVIAHFLRTWKTRTRLRGLPISGTGSNFSGKKTYRELPAFDGEMLAETTAISHTRLWLA